MTEPNDRPLPGRWAAGPAVMALALLGWVALAPAEARAGCRYPGHAAVDRGLLPSILHDPAPDGGGDATSPLPPGPCRGAWCQGAPGVPSVPAGAARLRAEQWAWHPSVPAPDPSAGVARAGEPADPSLSRRPDPLFRPPRPRPCA